MTSIWATLIVSYVKGGETYVFILEKVSFRSGLPLAKEGDGVSFERCFL